MKTADAAFFVGNAESGSQIFIDRVNFVIVVRFDENVANQDAREDGAERQLQISVVAQCESLARGAEKSPSARFRSNDRGEHRPPWDSAAAEREVFEIFFLPAHVEADGNDDDKVEEENSGIDCQSRVHFGGYLATDEHR